MKRGRLQVSQLACVSVALSSERIASEEIVSVPHEQCATEHPEEETEYAAHHAPSPTAASKAAPAKA